eukprot:scaffold12121_cov85-Cylindrotheca_fusiformis.AAC.1
MSRRQDVPATMVDFLYGSHNFTAIPPLHETDDGLTYTTGHHKERVRIEIAERTTRIPDEAFREHKG